MVGIRAYAGADEAVIVGRESVERAACKSSYILLMTPKSPVHGTMVAFIAALS